MLGTWRPAPATLWASVSPPGHGPLEPPRRGRSALLFVWQGCPPLLLLLVLRVGVWRDRPHLLILILQKQLFRPRIKDSPCLAAPAENKRLRFIVFIPRLAQIQLLEAPLPCSLQQLLPASSPHHVLKTKVGRNDEGHKLREAIYPAQSTPFKPRHHSFSSEAILSMHLPKAVSSCQFLPPFWIFWEMTTHMAKGWFSPSV